MCLMLWLEVEASQREQLEIAASRASGGVIQVAVQHAPRWLWATQQPARAFLSEAGGCACSLLTDDADWEAATWRMRPEILEPLADTIGALLATSLDHPSIQALWIGEATGETKHVSPNEVIALTRTSRLGTKTRYVIDRAS